MIKEYRSYDDAKKIVDEYEKEERASLESEKKRMATGKSPLGENLHSISVNDNNNKSENEIDKINIGNSTENTKKEFRSYDDAKKFVRPLKLKNYNQWLEYCKSGNKPLDIPDNPWDVYDQEWCGNIPFLGVNSPPNVELEYRSLSESTAFVQRLNLKNYDGWVKYCRSGKKPDSVPTEPEVIYKKENWIGWGHFLGTVVKRTPEEEKNMTFRSFQSAQEFVQEEKYNGKKMHKKLWYNYCRSGNKPTDIPSFPDIIYQKEWKNWQDFFNTGKTEYRSFEEARKFVQSLNLKNNKEWQEYCKSGNKPDDIPSTPWKVYKEWNKK